MAKKLWISQILFWSVFSAGAHASILFEPYAGYSVGSVALKYSDTYSVPALQGYTDRGSINGFGYGGRVGFLVHHFVILAAEYQGVSAKQKLDKNTTASNWTQKTMFATFGFQAPSGFRLLASYGWDFQADLTGPPDTHFKGTAAKFALGWHLSMPVAINLEYTIYRMTDYTTGGVTSKIADTYSKMDYSTVMATLSFPFELFH